MVSIQIRKLFRWNEENVRSGNKVLSQMMKRISERKAVADYTHARKNKYNPVGLSSINPNSKADSFCLIKNGVALKVTGITESHVQGLVFNELADYFKRPRNSTEMGIYVSSGLDYIVRQWPISDFTNCIKCFSLSTVGRSWVIVPLLHHIDN